ncbi:ependymin-like [Genypterus blacodes]|uniref:ependymin-like n=1 Tax=Genypterus blacodes TaxID=154954 RepID=UPI003F76161C
MNLLSVLCCLGLLLAAAAAQKPKPCVSPPLMTGQYTAIAASGKVSGTGDMSFDTFGQKLRAKYMATINKNQTMVKDFLMLFKQKIYYEIDWVKWSCKKKRLDGSFVPMAVPEDAQLMGQAYLGSSSSWGMGVLANTWYGSHSPDAYYMAVFTEVGCIPMTYASCRPHKGWAMVSTFNWVVGNTNPMDYIPPFFCDKARLEETEEEPESFFTIMESLAVKPKEE